MVANILTRRLHQVADRFLFRVPRVEPGETVLRQRRIFVLPTRAGFGFALALVVMLVASINYNLSLGYALVFLIAGIAVVSIVHAFRNLLGLTVAPGRAEPVFAGETAQFHLRLRNDQPRRRPALRFIDDGEAQHFDLAASASDERPLRRHAERRGWLPIGRVVLETRYPLGLIRAWSVLRPDARCLIWPAPEPSPPPLPDDGGGATGKRATTGGDDDFAGLRGHDPADSPRHVAWKVVARGGPMLTKRFTGLDGGDLLLDWHALPGHLDVEQRIARLAAWALKAHEQGRPFGLRLPDAQLAPARGRAHLHQCLTNLALHGAGGAGQARDGGGLRG